MGRDCEASCKVQYAKGRLRAPFYFQYTLQHFVMHCSPAKYAKAMAYAAIGEGMGVCWKRPRLTVFTAVSRFPSKEANMIPLALSGTCRMSFDNLSHRGTLPPRQLPLWAAFGPDVT